MEASAIRKVVRPLIWDYDVDAYEVYEVALGRKASAGSFTQEKALRRFFERLSWYDLVRLFGIDTIRELLTPHRMES